MKCHVPGPNVKGRTIHALARFGDELYLESLADCIILRTLNASESAYAMLKFNRNFFSYFNYNYYATEDNEGLKCKISMKSALNCFKSPAHMDKQVENLEIKLDPEQCKLIFQFKCKHGIVKTHFISILDSKVMDAVYTKDLVPNRITSSQRILSEAIGNFQNSDDQVTLEALSQNILLRNYIDANADLSRIIRTQINIRSVEFDSYIIGSETIITFTTKEFKALLAFAEALSLPIQIQFESTGKPVVFIIHNSSTIEAHFVLATSKPDNATQGTSTQNSSRVEKSKRKDSNLVQESASKKLHLDMEISKCLDEDSHLFNFVDIPCDVVDKNNCDNIVDFEKNCVNNSVMSAMDCDNIPGIPVNNSVMSAMDCDNIPASPTSKTMIKSVFKRCFESTFDPRSIQRVVLAENSDSE